MVHFHDSASRLMSARRWAEARAVLEDAISGMTADWKPVTDEADRITIAFWDVDEFHAYTRGRRADKPLFWVDESFSKAWYRLAFIAIEEARLDNAVVCIQSGIALEPDHPLLWSERGFILNRLGRHDEALACYQRALTVRSWAPKAHLAQVFCGQGTTLIDMGRLDDAETALRRSLELHESIIARQALDHLNEIRSQKPSVPWFIHALLYPPQDTMTVQLLALAEDLDPIPGPESIGSEEFSIILDAFMDRGWEGFEEAFDSIVPRSRPDYIKIKHNLLRDSIFNRKGHRNAVRLMRGDATLEQIHAEVSNAKDSAKKH